VAVTRHIVMSRHLNPHNNIFGGVMLAWLDEASGLFVMENVGYTNFVTVSMDNVVFKQPARGGDLVTVGCRTIRTGKSSITVETLAVARNPKTGDARRIIDCNVSLVAILDGKPFPYFTTPEYQAWCANNEVP
jgi:acyl-CoA hydrolase